MDDDVYSFPVSLAQQRLWFLQQLQPDTSSYNLTYAGRFAGSLDPDALLAAVTDVVVRHDALRTTFALVDGEPTQLVAESARYDLRDEAVAGFTEALAAATAQASAPFDLEKGPLLRVYLGRIADGGYLLGITVHHIVADGWSVGILVRDLFACYAARAAGAPPQLAELPIQYPDYAVWQRERGTGGVVARELAHWRQRLAGAPERVELATDRPRPLVRSQRGGRLTRSVPRAAVQRLEALCKEDGATLFMGVSAAFAALLRQHSGQDDIVVGVPVAGRRRPEVEGVVGLFTNTLVLRTDLSGDPSFRELLGRVRVAALDVLAHQELPFEMLVDELRPAREFGENPLFNVMLNVQNTPAPAVDGLAVEPVLLDTGGEKFDLTVSFVAADGRLDGLWSFSTDLFDRAGVVGLAERLEVLLDAVLARPDEPLSRLDLLGDALRARLAEWNSTARDYGFDGGLADLALAGLARRPDAEAVSFGGERLTFAELDERSARLAGELARRGVGRGSIVGVCLQRCLDLPVALLAVVRAGAAYLPLEPSYPPRRLAYMVADAEPTVVVSERRWQPVLPAEATVLWLDDVPYAPPLPPVRVHGTDLAYVMYTSGSTGDPKGVMCTHQGIVNRLLWMQETYALGSDDTVLHKTPYGFDVSVWEFFWPMLAGARLVVAEPGGHQDPDYLHRVIAAERVTTVHFVPSMLRAFLDTAAPQPLPSLRRVVCSGEALPADLAESFHDRLGGELHNLYGPTEAAVDVTAWHHRPGDGDVVPIGRPIANTTIHVLDRWLNPVPVGVPGELFIGGVSLARGYLNRPELTAASFIPDPFSDRPGARLYRTGDLARHRPDGALEYLGRTDHQVKLRGQRVELGEIEAQLRRHPAVADAVVTVAGPALAAYLIPQPQQSAPTSAELRAHLAAMLPAHMVPASYTPLAEIPRTPNGKVDRGALPRPGVPDAGGHAAPASPEQQVLADVWGEVLGTGPVGVHDNFFALGGDSLLAIQARQRARERGLDISLQQLFQHPTVASLAAVAAPISAPDEQGRATATGQRLPASLEDAYPLTRLQLGMLFHAEYSPDEARYHNIARFRLDRPLDEPRLRAALQALLARHPALRTSFDLAGFDEPMQLVHRTVELTLDTYDLVGSPAAQRDAEVERYAEAEKRRPFATDRAPLVRFAVHRHDASFDLTVTECHAVLDGWSHSAMLLEIYERYADPAGAAERYARPPSPAMREAVRLERAALDSAECADFWRRRLAGNPAGTVVAAGGSGPRRRTQVEVPIGAEVSDGLRRLAQETGAPLKSVALAAHLRVLSLLNDTDDVVAAVVTHGRPEDGDGDRALGLFLNVVPARLRLTPMSWRSFVAATFALEQEEFPYRRYPASAMGALPGNLFVFSHYHLVGRAEQLDGFEEFAYRYDYSRNEWPFEAQFRVDARTGRLLLFLVFDTCGDVEAGLDAYYARTLAAMAEDPDADWDSTGPMPARVPAVLLGPSPRTEPPRPEPRRSDPPVTAAQRLLAGIWAQVLATGPVGIHDDFVALGGDSLRAIQVAHRARAAGLALDVRDVIDRPTIAQVADAASAVGEPPAPVTAQPAVALPDTLILEPRPLLSLVATGEIPRIDAAALAVLPDSLPGRLGLSREELRRDLLGGVPVVSDIYELALGRIGMVMLPVYRSDVYADPEGLLSAAGAAVNLAGMLGARSISLTDLLGSATDYGRALVQPPGMTITTGHATTAGAVVETLLATLRLVQREPSGERLGFLGLGSIGTATLRLALRVLDPPAEILLCDVPRVRPHLAALVREARDAGYTGPIRVVESHGAIPPELYEATTIIGATNVGGLLDIARVAPGTIVVDDSEPHCFDPAEAIARFEAHRDVLFTIAGVLLSPTPVVKLRWAPERFSHLMHDLRFTPEDAYAIAGCTLSSLLTLRVDDLPATLGLVDGTAAEAHHRAIHEHAFTARMPRTSDGYVLSPEGMAAFATKFGGTV
ncbi:amino acid adenylation domain-containing protein [Micromonospora sp. NPDC049047]|uniref:amino acid adenylation domain-containing protein n=1 Tax=Micromonospora sp. NPDC049047 TaxID=3155645 RepID=UPI0033D177E3